MKLLYMLKKQYSRFCLREMVVVAQIVLIVLLFTLILSKLDRLLSIDQLAKNIQGPALFFQADDYYFMPEFLDAQEYSAFFDEIRKCDAVQEVGQTSVAGCAINGQGASVYFYNDALLKHLRLQTADYKSEDDAIPVLINQSLTQKYRIGDHIIPDNGTIFFPVSSEYQTVQFRVAGVLKNNDYYYSLVGGASRITLESIGYRDDGLCMIALGSFNIVPVLDIDPSSLLFIETECSDTVNQINASIGHLGHAESIEVMRKNSLNNILSTNSSSLCHCRSDDHALSGQRLLLCICERYSPTGKFCNVLYLWSEPEEGAGDSHDCAAIAADYQPSHFSGFSAAFC